MRRLRVFSCCLLLASSTLLADSKNPGDYPLRLHILGHNGIQYLQNRATDEVKGEGRADLFAGGEVKAVDFTYDCSDKIKNSSGYETYPAKWKKPGVELTVLFPVFAKTGSYFTCNLKTAVKDFAYIRHNGSITSEPSADYKAWMVRHEYDPEHGKDAPTKLKSKTGDDQ